MGSMPFALSVHNFISSVGADAGFASIIGLAIVVLLYFAHARETTALREQAADLAARLQDAEARLAEATRTGIAVGPETRAVPAPGGGGASVTPPPATTAGAVRVAAAARPVAVALASAPGPPAGMAAPALAAATRFIPVVSTVGQPAPQTQPELPAPPSMAPALAADEPALSPPQAAPREPAQPPVPQSPSPVLAPAATATALPAPQTVAGASNGAAGGRGASPPIAPQARPTPSRPGGPPARSPQPSGRRPYPPLSPPPRRSHRGRRVASVVIGGLVVVGAIVALLIVTSGGGKESKSAGTRTSNTPRPTPRPAAFTPASVTVSVLNGTATNQLAHRIALRLIAAGYKEGRVATASDQTRATTTVAYLAGHRADALHVASSLRLGPASVQPIDSGTQQVACPGAGACSSGVVVTVGADLANS